MNEVKFKANKKDLETIGGEIQEATAALDTTDATAGQVLKVETPGEAPVWGEAGLVLNTTHISKSLNASQINQLVRGEVPYIYITAQFNGRGDRAFFAGSRNTTEPIKKLTELLAEQP